MKLNQRSRYTVRTPDRAAARDLTVGDEIVWRDGTSTSVLAADDDETRCVYLALTNGHGGTVRRGRQFHIIRRAADRTPAIA